VLGFTGGFIGEADRKIKDELPDMESQIEARSIEIR